MDQIHIEKVELVTEENATSMFPGVGCSILLSKAITLFCRVERPAPRPRKAAINVVNSDISANHKHFYR